MPDFSGLERRHPQRTECPSAADCRHAHEAAAAAADEAVKKVFAILGVDVSKPSEVEEFRKDLRFGQSMRRAADKGFVAMVTVIGGGVMYALWAGLLVKTGGK